MRQEVSIKALSVSTEAELFSGAESLIHLDLKEVLLPVFTSLHIKPFFKNSSEPLARLRLRSSVSRPKRFFEIPFTFSHRGIWEIEKYEYSLEDIFGLTRYRWKQTPQQADSFVVTPPKPLHISVPLLSSSFREGEFEVTHRNRAGDYYDLKTYHPSDGLNKIVWKIYAKNRNLVSRQPESATTPEGSAILFIAAETLDDTIAGFALRYAELLEKASITFEAGCLGMNQKSSSTTHELRTMLIESAWKASYTDKLEEFERFLSSALIKAPSLHQVLLFIPSDRQEWADFALRLGNLAHKMRINPVFICSKTPGGDRHDNAVRSFTDRWFFENTSERASTTPESFAEGAIHDIESQCRRQQWLFYS